MFILFSVCSSIFYETSSKISNLLRSYSGECLGSSSDEERSELRYAIWIAEFRELLDLWTHAAFWGNPVCSVTGVWNSFFRHGLVSWICVLSVLQSLLGTSNASGVRSSAVRASLSSTQGRRSSGLTHSWIFWFVCVQQLPVACRGFVMFTYITRFHWSYPLNLSI